MRPLWIVAAIACGVFAVAGVASASVREEARSLASTLATVTAVGDDASPSPLPSPSPTESTIPSPTPSPSTTPLPTPGETAAPPRNHGEAVSAVAKDKQAVGTKTLSNGKTVTNHGMAVSAAARDKADKQTESATETGGKGHAVGKTKGKSQSGR